jgi:hypothetical protein
VAFGHCTSLMGVYFEGNAPSIGSFVFLEAYNATVYYLAGTTGWEATFSDRPAMLFDPLVPFTYTTNNGTITLTNYIGPGGAVTIPSTINGLPVTRVGDSTFGFRSDLTSVTIGTNVASIGQHAFLYCFSLASVTIPDSVLAIGGAAFVNCFSLTSVTIPSDLAWIEDFTFSGCTSLTNVTISDSVTAIGREAFRRCTDLASIMISEGVTNIGAGAFADCPSLTAITVDLPNPAYRSVDGVLFDWSTNTLLQYPGGKAGAYAIPNNIVGIGSLAFSGCTLTNVTIPNSVTSIGANAFNESSLTSVTIPNGVTNIGEEAFFGCADLAFVSIPGSVTALARSTFLQCSNLTSVALPNSLKSIGATAFLDTGLTNVTIPNGVTNIEDGAFGYCYNLTGVYFQGDAPSTGADVFHGAENSLIYYLPGTTGWGATFGGRPTALWLPQMQASDNSFGLRTNQFGFNIAWASGVSVVVDACTNLANPIWSALQTNTFTSDTLYFSC